MAYGFSATGDNSSYLLDSSKENTVHFSIHTKGSVSAGQSVSKGHSDLMFAKPSSTSSTANSRVTFDAVSNGGQVTFYKGVDYIILKQDRYANISGTYGLQLKNSSGTVTFDSRAGTGEGLKFKQVTQRATLGGAPQPGDPAGEYGGSNNVPIASGLNHFTNNSSASTLVYTPPPGEDLTNIYVLAAGGYYQDGTSSGQPYFTSLGSMYWHTGSSPGIYLDSYIYLSIADPSGVTGYSNWADIIVAELIE